MSRYFAASLKNISFGVILLSIIGVTSATISSPARAPATDVLLAVRDVMATPDDKIDFAKAKLTFDKLYDPATDIDGRLKEIDEMAQTIRTMAGSSAPPRLRLVMLRKYIYEAGPWNQNNPFQYDLSDPFGRKPANRLLSTYLATHRGNCVSMPILFAALAQRLGLNATLSTAPGHMFIKYTDDVTGKTFNLETTSGAYPARDVWIRKIMPMTDKAIANGLYMKTLSRKEALAVMAGIVLEHEFAEKKYQEAWDGLAWKDTSGKARAFLAETGNPYQRIALDPDGSAGIPWGIQDVPQTFVVDGRGVVRARIAGEMSKDVSSRQLLPSIAGAKKTS
jgi:regulator of sirC expression with transglutaminase-like and TPR domain